METFRMIIARDKAKDWQDDIKDICDGLRKRGMIPQGFERDENNFTIGGTYGEDEGCAD